MYRYRGLYRCALKLKSWTRGHGQIHEIKPVLNPAPDFDMGCFSGNYQTFKSNWGPK